VTETPGPAGPVEPPRPAGVPEDAGGLPLPRQPRRRGDRPDRTGAAAEPWPAPRASKPVDAVVPVPGSKSMTARALVLAAVSVGPSTLRAPLVSRDTGLIAFGLRAMGTYVSTVDDDLWVVRPHPLHGPARIDVEAAGTALRFLPPVAGLATGPVTFTGDARATGALEPMVTALGMLGIRAAATGGGLPLTVTGIGRVRGGDISIDASASSQLVSGLLLAGTDFDQGLVLRHDGPPLPAAPHIELTVAMLRAAGAGVDDSAANVWEVEPGRLLGRGWHIEPDLAGAAAFLAAAVVTGGRVTVPGWPQRTPQPSVALQRLLTGFGASCTYGTDGLTVRGGGRVHGIDADVGGLGDLLPVTAALCALADGPSRLHGVSALRGGPVDRVSVLVGALGTLGVEVTEEADVLAIRPGPRHGGVLDTGADRRLAHAGAVLGLAVDGVALTDVTCTAKSLPDFPAMWHDLLGGGP
jgi:3-phosphoshikimate 1-carboxyvinyltransferase